MPERDDAIPGLAGVIAWCEEQRAYCRPAHLTDASDEELAERRGPCAAYGAVVYGLVIDKLRALRAAQPEAGSEEAERLDERARINARYAGKLSAERDEARAEVARLRAAHPEADRAPGEVEAVQRVLEEADLHMHTRMECLPLKGDPAQETAEDVLAALDALRSEQGQSRDDTVTLAEAVHRFLLTIDAYPPEVESADSNAWRVGGAAREAWSVGFVELRAALARFGAGRAEGEDRDTENEG